MTPKPQLTSRPKYETTNGRGVTPWSELETEKDTKIDLIKDLSRSGTEILMNWILIHKNGNESRPLSARFRQARSPRERARSAWQFSYRHNSRTPTDEKVDRLLGFGNCVDRKMIVMVRNSHTSSHSRLSFTYESSSSRRPSDIGPLNALNSETCEKYRI